MNRLEQYRAARSPQDTMPILYTFLPPAQRKALSVRQQLRGENKSTHDRLSRATVCDLKHRYSPSRCFSGSGFRDEQRPGCVLLPHVFPQLSDMDVMEIWTVVDASRKGTVSLAEFLARLKSVEASSLEVPGPGYYSPKDEVIRPSVTVVSNRRPSRVTSQQQQHRERRLDHGSNDDVQQPQYDSVWPTTPELTFAKRTYAALGGVWCNPVPKPSLLDPGQYRPRCESIQLGVPAVKLSPTTHASPKTTQVS